MATGRFVRALALLAAPGCNSWPPPISLLTYLAGYEYAYNVRDAWPPAGGVNTHQVVFRRYGQPSSIDVVEVERPSIGANQILVRMCATSVNAGDWQALRGRPYLIRATGGMRRPKTGWLGVDVAGVVEEAGGTVTQFAPGEEVFGMVTQRAFADYVAESWIVPKPANPTFEEAAAVPAAGCTALQALRDHRKVESGQQVLIYGSGGGVGTFAVQLGKAFGAEVTALTSKPDVARSIGADHIIDYEHDAIERAGRRFDLVVDVGANRLIGELRRVLAPDGRLVVVGAGRGATGPIGRFAAAALRSVFLRQRVTGFVASPPFAENLDTLRSLIEAGALRPVVDSSYPLDRTDDAMRRFASGEVSGKVVITIPWRA